MATNRLVIMDPNDAEPTFVLASEARIVDMPDSWEGDGKALRKALDSGLLVLHPVGRAVGKKPGEDKAPATPATPAKTPPPAPKK